MSINRPRGEENRLSSDAQLINYLLRCSPKPVGRTLITSLTTRRTKREIELLIINEALEPVNKTRIQYKVKLSSRILKRHLKRMLEEGTIEQEGKIYIATKKGVKKALDILSGITRCNPELAEKCDGEKWQRKRYRRMQASTPSG